MQSCNKAQTYWQWWQLQTEEGEEDEIMKDNVVDDKAHVVKNDRNGMNNNYEDEHQKDEDDKWKGRGLWEGWWAEKEFSWELCQNYDIELWIV